MVKDKKWVIIGIRKPFNGLPAEIAITTWYSKHFAFQDVNFSLANAYLPKHELKLFCKNSLEHIKYEKEAELIIALLQ